MISSMRDCTLLNNGLGMPWLGFGVFKINDGQEVELAVRNALEIGYRSIDTATVYGNECGVGKSSLNQLFRNWLKNTKRPRRRLFYAGICSMK